MSVSLKHFQSSEIVFNQEQAGQVLRFFFPDQTIDPGTLTDNDISFAQALLVEAIDASNEMGYVQIIFDKAFMKIPNGFSIIKDLAKAVCRRAAMNWFRHATGKDMSDPQIYELVRMTLARNFRS